MRVRVKICGLTEPLGVETAVDAGADAVGFVFTESIRRVEPQRACELGRLATPYVARVAVFRNPDALLVETVRLAVDPDLFQCDANDAGRFFAIATRFLPVFREAEDDDSLQRHLDSAPHVAFLYEGRVSGAGRRVDWDHARALSERGRLVLAGGLDPDNVAHAIERCRPYAVDVSSGVESRPGVKDPARIRAFVAAVRDAERVRP